MSFDSRYVTYYRGKAPKRQKSKSIWGAGSGDQSDRNRYFKCWNCGFTVDSQADFSGMSPAGGTNAVYQEAVRASGVTPLESGTPQSATPALGFFGMGLQAMSTNTLSSDSTVAYVPRYAVAGRGCPFCHADVP